MEQFNQFPYELQSLIFEHAAEAAAAPGGAPPRLAVVTLPNPPQFGATVENGTHLLETRPARGLLETSYLSRDVTQRTLAGLPPPPPPDPMWALGLLGLRDLQLARQTDMILLQGGDWPFNYATALALVIGRAFPNIMLLAEDFTNGHGGSGVQPDTAPVDHSLHLLRNTNNPAFNNLHRSPPAGMLPNPEVPQNLYFVTGHNLPACPSSHPGVCIHYDQLDIIPDDRLGEWNLPSGSAESDRVAEVHRIWAGWQQLNVQLPNLFFARILPKADPVIPVKETQTVENADPNGIDPVEGEVQTTVYTGPVNVDAGRPAEVEAQTQDNVGPAIVRTGEPQAPGDWFNTVFAPAAFPQYIRKWKARNRNERWDGRSFLEVDATTPGPSDRARLAVQDWLALTMRPHVEAQIQKMWQDA